MLSSLFWEGARATTCILTQLFTSLRLRRIIATFIYFKHLFLCPNALWWSETEWKVWEIEGRTGSKWPRAGIEPGSLRSGLSLYGTDYRIVLKRSSNSINMGRETQWMYLHRSDVLFKIVLKNSSNSIKGWGIRPPGEIVIRRYKPFGKSASSDIIGGRVYLRCMTDRWALIAIVHWVGW